MLLRVLGLCVVVCVVCVCVDAGVVVLVCANTCVLDWLCVCRCLFV